MQQHHSNELLFSPRRNYLRTVQKGLLDEIEVRLRVVNFMIYASAHLHFYTDSLHLAVHNLIEYFHWNNMLWKILKF